MGLRSALAGVSVSRENREKGEYQNEGSDSEVVMVISFFAVIFHASASLDPSVWTFSRDGRMNKSPAFVYFHVFRSCLHG